jgi:hypothetical protein
MPLRSLFAKLSKEIDRLRWGPKTKVPASTWPLSENVALVPICQARRS